MTLWQKIKWNIEGFLGTLLVSVLAGFFLGVVFGVGIATAAGVLSLLM